MFLSLQIAFAITEEAQHRDLEGPSTTIPLSEMISSVLPPEKKDKLTDLNNVSHFHQENVFLLNFSSCIFCVFIINENI